MLSHDDPGPGRLLDLGMLVAAGLLSFIVFARVPVHALSPGFQSEFTAPALLLPSVEATGTAPYSLWYTLQRVLLEGNRDRRELLVAGWLILGALAVIKGLVLTGVLFATSASRLQALVVGFLLGTAVAFPIPFLERHSTQLMPSTTAVVAVVTLALWFQRPTGARFTSMILTGLLATWAKPGIAPALLMTVAVLSLLLVRTQRQEVRPALARLLIAVLVIGFPLLGAYRGFTSAAGFFDLHAEVWPLVTWTAFSDPWFPDLIASWAFPIAVVGVLWSTRNATPTRLEWLIPGWSVTLIATLLFALLAEVNGAGQVVHAGNFAWSALSATGGLYVLSAIALHGIPWRIRWIPTAVLALQASAGLTDRAPAPALDISRSAPELTQRGSKNVFFMFGPQPIAVETEDQLTPRSVKGRWVLVAPPVSTLRFALESDVHRLEGTYGLLPGAETNPKCDAVRFRIELRPEAGPRTTLFERVLDPRAGVHGPQPLSLDLPDGLRGEIVLITDSEPGRQAVAGYSYWGAFELR